MAGSGDEQHIGIARLDDTIEVNVEEIETRHRAPMAEQAGLGVLLLQRRAQQGIGKQIDLADREIIRGSPPRVHALELIGRKRGIVGHVISCCIRISIFDGPPGTSLAKTDGLSERDQQQLKSCRASRLRRRICRALGNAIIASRSNCDRVRETVSIVRPR